MGSGIRWTRSGISCTSTRSGIRIRRDGRSGKDNGETPIKKSFWRNKRVLITGFSGFLGSWLTKRLLHYGAKISGLDIRPARPITVLDRGELERVRVVKGSVENYQLVRRAISSHRAEYIFHLAARSLVEECENDPRQAFSTNIEGTWNVLEASRNCAVRPRGVIVASSDKAYGTHKKLPYNERCSLAGDHPYDVSKSCADLITQAYFRTYRLPVAIVRCGNIFGPGDHNLSRIVPDAVTSALAGKSLLIRSNGRYLRDYIYVEDAVKGYLTIGQKLERQALSGGAFNLSNEEPVSVLKLVKIISGILGRKPVYKILNRAENEIKAQYLSAAKAHNILSWRPEVKLEDGLLRTIEWYRRCVR